MGNAANNGIDDGAPRSSGFSRYLRIWRNDHWFWPYLRQHRLLLAGIFLVGALTFVCAAGLMFTSGFLISRSARHPYNIFAVYVPIVLTRAFGIGRPSFKYLERIASHDWVLRVVSKLRVQLYRTLSRDAAFLTEHERTGTVLGLLADDLDHLENFYLRTIFPTIVAYIMWIVVTIAVGVFSWQTSLILFLLFALVLIAVPLMSLAFSDARYAREKAAQQHEYTAVTESYLGLSDWFITHRGEEFGATGAEQFAQIGASQAEQKRFERWRNFAIQMIFAVMAVGLLAGSALFLTSSTSRADFAAAAVLSLFPLIDCFIVVAQAFAEVPLYNDSLGHLNALTERVEAHQPDEVVQQQLVGPLRAIDFDHVTFSYGPDQPMLLDDFSLHIEAGRKVALLGPSGEGKTTILQLLLGDLLPQRGEIRVNGIPVRALQAERARLFGYLNQQAFVFNTTIGDNVRLGRPDASDGDVWQALDDVQLGDFVRSLPNQLAEPVDESGRRLSGGQRQRLALARVLLKNTPVILLDEPTIGLDPITERTLMATILRVSRQRTLLWVTHHLQGLEDADRVVFLESGRIAMQGAPHELYRSNARFRELYRLDVGELTA
ncbi:thiol reductant ABC exporter subunit CydC [Bifidobacterium sp.]|jgi:ATP-binding cassette subfamily C protein CydC|uniref:thiol reductant ABC exporter subunit CydC n=1 Tax=Bifidobacterium sp. TaxID=41200 RepID=UPI0025C526BE|nr:thiol reductant ABC exporter subunit CydC [Bifidobacterium sp.]MCH4208892.1 thiol reductant ABC exporter subunit CydC [Bifidobacterium sp.]MCI1224439.1 thiol reductant ABC exporter subunit CydC [Bifidobacterium sp.]